MKRHSQIRQHAAWPLAAGFAASFISCGTASNTPSAPESVSAQPSAHPSSTSSTGSTTSTTSAAAAPVASPSVPSSEPTSAAAESFRFGINLGHPNPDFGDAEMSDLAAAVGVRSIRLKYPEYHFFNWGQTIEVADAQHYASLGMQDHVAFLIGMTEAHSTAPAGSEDWERDNYIPKNLYEPIFDADGAVNPNNYYAQYLADTFSTYAPYVKYWEIFNEPDWVSDWSVTQTWDTEPPTAAQLVRFHGSIYDYVRMLRIAKEVRDAMAPGTFILTGGLGYPSFLSALLRYTDNPDRGTVTPEFPKTGAYYFDVLSIHHYPHLVEDGSSDPALDSLIAARDAFQAELDHAHVTDKRWMITENGASHIKIADVASGPAYARNYLQKSMIWAKAQGFLGIDWFPLSDGTNATDAFSNMGLYHDISALAAPADAQPTDTGIAYKLTSQLLAGARFDAAATLALDLPPTARGYVFNQGSNPVYAVWAVTDDDETAGVSIELPLAGSVHALNWNSEPISVLEATDSHVTLDVGGDPIFVYAEP